MSSIAGTVLKNEPIMPWEQFSALTDKQREEYVNKQVTHSGVVALQVLDIIAEGSPAYIKLLEQVSGRKISPAGQSSRKGGSQRQYASQTRRKKSNNNH